MITMRLTVIEGMSPKDRLLDALDIKYHYISTLAHKLGNAGVDMRIADIVHSMTTHIEEHDLNIGPTDYNEFAVAWLRGHVSEYGLEIEELFQGYYRITSEESIYQ